MTNFILKQLEPPIGLNFPILTGYQIDDDNILLPATWCLQKIFPSIKLKPYIIKLVSSIKQDHDLDAHVKDRLLTQANRDNFRLYYGKSRMPNMVFVPIDIFCNMLRQVDPIHHTKHITSNTIDDYCTHLMQNSDNGPVKKRRNLKFRVSLPKVKFDDIAANIISGITRNLTEIYHEQVRTAYLHTEEYQQYIRDTNIAAKQRAEQIIRQNAERTSEHALDELRTLLASRKRTRE